MKSYFYIPQEPAYKTIVHSIWQVEGVTTFHNECIIPKGIVEIIFNFSDSLTIPAHIDNKQYQLPHCFINGFNTAPIFLHLPAQQNFFGVRVQPLAVKKYLARRLLSF